MSDVTAQLLLMALGSIGMFSVVLVLSRRGLLSLRYGLGWMCVCGLLLAVSVVLAITGGVSRSLPLTPTGLLAGGGFAFVLGITLQLSVSLSGQQEAIRELAEANAFLEERVRRLEARGRVEA